MLISPQHRVPGSRDSRKNASTSRTLQKLRKKYVQKLRVDFQPRLNIRPVADRRKPGRLGEGDQVRRDGHAHVVPAAPQLTPESHAGLDIAASSVERQHKFHRVVLALHFLCAFCEMKAAAANSLGRPAA